MTRKKTQLYKRVQRRRSKTHHRAGGYITIELEN